jgi:multisubunit Na+/H+ antiporter MnhC subunit
LSPDNETFVLIAIMSIPPGHVGIIPIPNNTRNAQVAQLAHVINTLLGYQAADPVPQALI